MKNNTLQESSNNQNMPVKEIKRLWELYTETIRWFCLSNKFCEFHKINVSQNIINKPTVNEDSSEYINYMAHESMSATYFIQLNELINAIIKFNIKEFNDIIDNYKHCQPIINAIRNYKCHTIKDPKYFMKMLYDLFLKKDLKINGKDTEFKSEDEMKIIKAASKVFSPTIMFIEIEAVLMMKKYEKFIPS